MSTQGVQVPRTWTGTTGPRRAAAAAVVLAALAVGAVVGRSTAPTARVREGVRPATALSDLGQRSVGDLKRNQYHLAMNELSAASPQGPGSTSWARHAANFTSKGVLLPQQAAG